MTVHERLDCSPGRYPSFTTVVLTARNAGVRFDSDDDPHNAHSTATEPASHFAPETELAAPEPSRALASQDPRRPSAAD